MAGKSPVVASEEQKRGLVNLAQLQPLGEADRAVRFLLTLSGWTQRQDRLRRFGVREDTVRLWRSDFMRGGVGALKTRVAPGPAPVKAECALAVAQEVLLRSVADRPDWTLPRLADEIEKRAGVRISRSRLSVVLRKRGFPLAAAPPHADRPARTLMPWTAPACVEAARKRRPRRATFVPLVRRQVRKSTDRIPLCMPRPRWRDLRVPAPGLVPKSQSSASSIGRAATCDSYQPDQRESTTSARCWSKSTGATIHLARSSHASRSRLSS